MGGGGPRAGYAAWGGLYTLVPNGDGLVQYLFLKRRRMVGPRGKKVPPVMSFSLHPRFDVEFYPTRPSQPCSTTPQDLGNIVPPETVRRILGQWETVEATEKVSFNAGFRLKQ